MKGSQQFVPNIGGSKQPPEIIQEGFALKVERQAIINKIWEYCVIQMRLSVKTLVPNGSHRDSICINISFKENLVKLVKNHEYILILT